MYYGNHAVSILHDDDAQHLLFLVVVVFVLDKIFTSYKASTGPRQQKKAKVKIKSISIRPRVVGMTFCRKKLLNTILLLVRISITITSSSNPDFDISISILTSTSSAW
jgi:hypothetical protein